MGTYTIACPNCKTVFLWFSGDSDQRCPACREKPDLTSTSDGEGDEK